MAFLEDITKFGQGAGQGLLDVINAITSPAAPILKQIEKAGAQYAAMQGNPIPLQQMQQQEQRNLLNQLVQQQFQAQPPAATAQPGMAQAQAQPAFQLQKTPQIESAIQSGDRNAFNKEVQRQQGLGNFEMSVRSNTALSDNDKTTLISAKNSGVPIDDLYKLQTQLMSKGEARSESMRKEQAALQNKLEEEKRKEAARKKQKEEETQSLQTFVERVISKNPALKSDPEGLSAVIAGFPGMAGKKPEQRMEIITGLQKLGMVDKTPSFRERIGLALEGLIYNMTRPPSKQPPALQKSALSPEGRPILKFNQNTMKLE
jgi:hypothetical protein